MLVFGLLRILKDYPAGIFLGAGELSINIDSQWVFFWIFLILKAGFFHNNSEVLKAERLGTPLYITLVKILAQNCRNFETIFF